MEFCKIPNFGTVTMKNIKVLVTMANHYDSEKNPYCKQKKLVLTFLPNRQDSKIFCRKDKKILYRL